MKTLLIIFGVLFVLALIYSVALFIAHKGNRDFLAIDSCLDSGGRWNYKTRTCEHR